MERLLTTRSAYFFRLRRPLTNVAVKRVFAACTKRRVGQAPVQVRRLRTTGGVSAHCSFVLFRVEESPSFLRGNTKTEIRYGFLLLLEVGDYLCVLRRLAGDPEPHVREFVSRVGHDAITRAFVDDETLFHRASFKFIGISNHILRAKTLEAVDLAGATSSLGLNRAIPKAATHSGNYGTHVVNPGTSHLTRRGERQNIDELIAWANSVATEIGRPGAGTSFLDRCARPASFDEIAAIEPSGILMGFEDLQNGLATGELEGPFLDAAASEPVDQDAFDEIIARYQRSLPLVRDGNTYDVVDGESGVVLGTMHQNKKTYTLRLPELSALHVIDRQSADAASLSLQRLVNRDKEYLVVYEDPKYAYFQSDLYRDGGLVEAARVMASACSAHPEMSLATAEKGLSTTGDIAFPDNSLFQIVEDVLIPNSWFLVCDDRGDEWADFIALSPPGEAPAIEFLHVKHDSPGFGASPLHVVVAQALKNAGRVTLPASELSDKFDDWDEMYISDKGVRTAIRHRRRGSRAEFEERYREVQESPHCVRRISLVVTALSKQGLTDLAGRLERGEPIPSHASQLLWLLSSFMGGCLEAQAQPYVYTLP